MTQDFIACFKLMTDCIVLVLNKGISMVTFKLHLTIGAADFFQKSQEGGVFVVIPKSLVKEFVFQHSTFI